jgi:FkbM family methyltransferase
MGNSTNIDPPFGTFALPDRREEIRQSASRFSDTKPGRWGISLARKRAIKGLAEPFDVNVASGVKARLYPSTNRCEKRALAGVQVWDAVERHAIRDAISTSTTKPFVFFDVGANVGLYSLFANAYAQSFDLPIQIFAAEPSAEIGARLEFNAAASEADIKLIRSAISTEFGDVFLSDGEGNRGEGKLSDQGEVVNAMTLLQLCVATGVNYIDTLKLDIEGVDLPVLTQFFEQAPVSLHPKMMILELDQNSAEPIIALVQTHNYLITNRTRMNAVVTKRDP